MFLKSPCLLVFIASIAQVAYSWPVEGTIILTHNGPIVAGNTITFKAEIIENGEFEYIWEDNAVPAHSDRVRLSTNKFEWNVTYPSHTYYPGTYEMQLKVKKKIYIIYIDYSSVRVDFNITGFLNGDLKLIQKNKEIAHDTYVAVNQELTHVVALNEADLNFVKTNATQIDTYIFIDCQYMNVTKGLTYKHNYTKVNAEHLIEMLVIVSFDPPVIQPTEKPPTNQSSIEAITTAATILSNETSQNNLTANKNNENVTTGTHDNSTSKLQEINVSEIRPNKLTTLLPKSSEPSVTENAKSTEEVITPPSVSGFPYVCNNSSMVAPDISKTYGYFSKKVKVEAEISKISAVGNLWLPHGDMLELEITCNGTGPFMFCAEYVRGAYNVTGDETCGQSFVYNNDQCSFNIIHYFQESTEYTLVVILENNVNKVVSKFGINIYEVVKHAELSVIVVPVSASLLAVILIVFGLAYYIQSRNRFLIETADFDFSNTSTDLEYKTFRERLRDAMSSAINKTTDYVDQENVWSPPGQSSGRKYGSMQ